MEYNDYELIYYCHQNNYKSFEILVNKYEKYIYYIINTFKKTYYFAGYEDQDLYNEGVLLLYECIFSYQEIYDVSFATFFVSCFKKKLQYIIRKIISNKNKINSIAYSLDALNDDSNQDMHQMIGDSGVNVSESVMNNDLLNKKIKSIGKHMNKDEIKIVYMYLIGYPYIDIAQELCVSKKKVDNTIQKYKKIVCLKD